MKRKITMKNVAGFHSFDLGTFGDGEETRGFRKNLGMIECHTDGRTAPDMSSVEVA